LIKHPRFLNHPGQYLIIHVIRQNILGIDANSVIFSRLGFGQLKDDTVYGSCSLGIGILKSLFGWTEKYQRGSAMSITPIRECIPPLSGAQVTLSR